MVNSIKCFLRSRNTEIIISPLPREVVILSTKVIIACSYYCTCNIGVRQGDNLSPVRVALFINDFTEYVSTAYGVLNIAQSCSHP